MSDVEHKYKFLAVFAFLLLVAFTITYMWLYCLWKAKIYSLKNFKAHE